MNRNTILEVVKRSPFSISGPSPHPPAEGVHGASGTWGSNPTAKIPTSAFSGGVKLNRPPTATTSAPPKPSATPSQSDNKPSVDNTTKDAISGERLRAASAIANAAETRNVHAGVRLDRDRSITPEFDKVRMGIHAARKAGAEAQAGKFQNNQDTQEYINKTKRYSAFHTAKQSVEGGAADTEKKKTAANQAGRMADLIYDRETAKSSHIGTMQGQEKQKGQIGISTAAEKFRGERGKNKVAGKMAGIEIEAGKTKLAREKGKLEKENATRPSEIDKARYGAAHAGFRLHKDIDSYSRKLDTETAKIQQKAVKDRSKRVDKVFSSAKGFISGIGHGLNKLFNAK